MTTRLTWKIKDLRALLATVRTKNRRNLCFAKSLKKKNLTVPKPLLRPPKHPQLFGHQLERYRPQVPLFSQPQVRLRKTGRRVRRQAAEANEERS